jgi:T-complex protein 1 subunit theta
MSSMAYNSASGLSGMLKSGHSHWDNAVLRNIEAAMELSAITSTSLGPFGRHKLLVNHLEKLYVTSDCNTILRELEVEHPAAKLLKMAADMQDQTCGDATNLVVSFAGELLRQTQDLMRMGLHTSEVISGYTSAAQKLQELLPTLVCETVVVKDATPEQLALVINPVLASKHYGTHQLLSPLILDACNVLMEKTGTPNVQPEAVRVVKLLGSSVDQSSMIPGYVAQRGVETTLTTIDETCKIAVFACGMEASSTEAKGTVLMKTADDLKGYNLSEETKMEELIQSIAESGVQVVVTGGNVSEMALHFINRYQLMCLKIGSKWELRRLCQATGATALVRLGPPTPDEMGIASSVKQKHVGGKTLTVFTTPDSKLATLVLRASTSSVLQDLERAVDDGVHAFQQLCRDGRVVPGAGATEMALSHKLQQLADVSPGLDQYAIRAFAKALEVVPRTLAETAGLDATKMVADLHAAHANGEHMAGVDLEEGKVAPTNIVDLLNTKASAFALAVDAAMTVLRVDQIIMSKQAGAGGPSS